MAKTLADLQAEVTKLVDAVETEVEQAKQVVAAIEALIKKIEESGNTDFTAEVEALNVASAKLAGDNEAVQAAIDKAVPPQG